MTKRLTAPVLCLLLALLASCACTGPRPQHSQRDKPLGIIAQPQMLPVLYQGRERYQLVAPWGFKAHGLREELPVGVVMDGASVPRPVWWFMPPDGLHRSASLAHDWLYLLRGKLYNGLTLTRAQSDQLFYHYMIESGVGKFRASTAYNAVRLGGGRSWRDGDGVPTVCPLPVYDLPPLSKTAKKPLLKPKHIYAR